jgi:hypothetical protein
MPRDPVSALARPELYGEAFPEDAAVFRYADIPVDHAAQPGVVAAMLVARAQDFGLQTPNEVMVGIVRENRVYFADAPARALIAPMAACVSIWDEAMRKRDSLLKAGKSNPKDTTASDLSSHIEENADAAARQCYAEHAPADPRFAALAQQVASIVQRVAPQ